MGHKDRQEKLWGNVANVSPLLLGDGVSWRSRGPLSDRLRGQRSNCVSLLHLRLPLTHGSSRCKNTDSNTKKCLNVQETPWWLVHKGKFLREEIIVWVNRQKSRPGQSFILIFIKSSKVWTNFGPFWFSPPPSLWLPSLFCKVCFCSCLLIRLWQVHTPETWRGKRGRVGRRAMLASGSHGWEACHVIGSVF